MTIFYHTKEHELDCQCSYCMDVDPTKSVSAELEKYVEELMVYAVQNLEDQHHKKVDEVSNKILLLRRYFPTMELPSKHQQLLKNLK